MFHSKIYLDIIQLLKATKYGPYMCMCKNTFFKTFFLSFSLPAVCMHYSGSPDLLIKLKNEDKSSPRSPSCL